MAATHGSTSAHSASGSALSSSRSPSARCASHRHVNRSVCSTPNLGVIPIQPPNAQEPPMKIKRIEHIAIAVKSIKAMRDIFENKLGIEMEYEEHLPEHSTSLAMFPVG